MPPQVPACYRQPAPRLKPGYFSKFQQDTLFYIFYSMPADEAQVFAADELASRGWWFHKELKVPRRQSTLLSTNLVRRPCCLCSLAYELPSGAMNDNSRQVLDRQSMERRKISTS